MKAPNVLKIALEDAELLLTYASRNGVDVDPKCVSGLTKAVSGSGTNDDERMSAEELADFHTNYRALAQTVAPVTASSIRDSDDAFAEARPLFLRWGPLRRSAPASGAVLVFTAQTFLALVCLLYLQVIWAFGNTLVDKLAKAKQEFVQLGAELSRVPADEAASRRLAATIENTVAEIQTLYRSISKWRQSVPIPKEKIDPPPIDPSNYWQDGAIAGQLRTSAENMVTMLQVYFLPLLYGWLGASSYVLRQLIQEIRAKTYRRAMNRAFFIRVVLGVVAGLSIGWFYYRPESDAGGAHVTPLALSFLAGYSVEVLFSAMDKFISAFGAISQNAKS